jgi:uncharacterized protein YggT (Ycf19 family)
MDLIHLTLNLAALLLWVNWRTLGYLPRLKRHPVALLSTARTAMPGPGLRWIYFAMLLSILLVRSLFYAHIGPAVDWNPHIDFRLFTLSFRSDFPSRMLLYSGLSFLFILGGFFMWLILFSIANHKLAANDPWHIQVRLHLGWIDRWPVPLKLILPFLLTALIWVGLSAWFSHLHILPPPQVPNQAWLEAAFFGLAVYLFWKYLIVLILFLHILNTYIYLGHFPVWTFISTTARNLLRPIAWIPLRLGKIDLAPPAGIALILAASHYAEIALTRFRASW